MQFLTFLQTAFLPGLFSTMQPALMLGCLTECQGNYVKENIPNARRSFQEWRDTLDWQLWIKKPFVVLDLQRFPEGLHYFSLLELATWVRINDIDIKCIKFIATPLQTPPFWSIFTKPYASFCAFALGVKVLNLRDGLIAVDEKNLTTALLRWAEMLYLHSSHKLMPIGIRRLLLKEEVAYLCKFFSSGGNLPQLMKVSLFAINAFLSGNPLKDTLKLGIAMRLTARGLPKWLGLRARNMIYARHVPSIRFIQSFLNSYKSFDLLGREIDLSTIGTPRYSNRAALEDFRTFVPRFFKTIPVDIPKRLPHIHMSTLVSAGANVSSSVLSAMQDAWCWASLGSHNSLYNYLAHMDYSSATIVGAWLSAFNSVKHVLSKRATLGRLSFKFEAAGKVRVFAIVDYWSQIVLSPLHRWLFSILKELPTDATYNQDSALDTFVKKGGNSFYCYDLKSATDHIPVQLMTLLLAEAFGEAFALSWEVLMIGRWFVIPLPKKGERLVYKFFDGTVKTAKQMRLLSQEERQIKWTRGQPMGMKSSWAMLALVHHALIQYAFYRTQVSFISRENGSVQKRDIAYTWYSNYLICGDDLVIGDLSVANSYLEVCELFSIPVGMAKSFTSTEGFLNFINQSYLNQVNVSPLSLKEESKVDTFTARLEMLRREVRRGWAVDGQRALNASESLERKFTRILIMASSPSAWLEQQQLLHSNGFLSSYHRWIALNALAPIEGNHGIHSYLGLTRMSVLPYWFRLFTPGPVLLHAIFSENNGRNIIDNPNFQAALITKVYIDALPEYTTRWSRLDDSTRRLSHKLNMLLVPGFLSEYQVRSLLDKPASSQFVELLRAEPLRNFMYIHFNEKVQSHAELKRVMTLVMRSMLDDLGKQKVHRVTMDQLLDLLKLLEEIPAPLKGSVDEFFALDRIPSYQAHALEEHMALTDVAIPLFIEGTSQLLSLVEELSLDKLALLSPEKFTLMVSDETSGHTSQVPEWYSHPSSAMSIWVIGSLALSELETTGFPTRPFTPWYIWAIMPYYTRKALPLVVQLATTIDWAVPRRLLRPDRYLTVPSSLQVYCPGYNPIVAYGSNLNYLKTSNLSVTSLRDLPAVIYLSGPLRPKVTRASRLVTRNL